MLSSKNEVTDLALEMAWSLWAELGASGWVRRHTWQAIDVEPLILFTAWLGDTDVRLRDEALRWCVANARLTSAVRLRNLLRGVDPSTAAAFSRFAATVKAHVHVPWPGEGEPLPFRVPERGGDLDLSRPALLQLRLRSVTGVSARAELLRLLLATPNHARSASDLAVGAAYGKGNVVGALEMLTLSGVVEAGRVGNQLRYRLARPAELAALVGGTPTLHPDWAPIFRITTALVELGRSAPVQPLVRAADIRRLLRAVEADLRRLDLAEQLPQATGEALGEDFDRWAAGLLREWAGVADIADAGTKSEATYTVHRLTTGDWLATVAAQGERARPLELPEWAGLHEDHPRSDTVIADDTSGAPTLAHAMLTDAERRIGVDIGPHWSPDPKAQMVARALADERLWYVRPGQSVTFTAGFLRAWRADRLRRLEVS